MILLYYLLHQKLSEVKVSFLVIFAPLPDPIGIEDAKFQQPPDQTWPTMRALPPHNVVVV